MKNCNTCAHWDRNDSLFHNGRTGRCSEIHCADEVDIDVHYGWDGGYINYVDTAKDFGCSLHRYSDKMKRYVIGIAFDPTYREVVMVLKDRPEWQAGLYNFPGGKVEKDEEPDDCMPREFKEECGLETRPIDWHLVGELEGDDYVLYVYTTVTSIEGARTMESEMVTRMGVEALPRNVVGNIPWLLAYALDHWTGGPGGNVRMGTFSYRK
jgi:8-oxo-dGTP diphosphatase